MIKVAFIGGGAVVQRSHFPALYRSNEMELVAIADTDLDRLSNLSSQYQNCIFTNDAQEAIDIADLIVIATPSASHHQLGMQALAAKKHVLMEKPLAINKSEATELVRLAENNNRLLAVSLIRRFVTHNLLFKHLLSIDLVGDIQSINVEEGGLFNWPVQSVDFYDPQKSGGGVLIDNGAHLLDLLIWWLGPLDLNAYFDDAQGGVEAECEIEFSTNTHARGLVKMSRLRNLKNQIYVSGTKGDISMDLASGSVNIQVKGEQETLMGQALSGVESSAAQSTIDLFAAQYDGISHMIKGTQNKQGGSLVLGKQCLLSIDLIDQCYKIRAPLVDQVI